MDAVHSAVSGERPAIIVSPNIAREVELVAREVTYLTKKLGLTPSQICCVSRAAHVREAILKELGKHGIAALNYRADGVSDGKAVLVSTLHNAKGHEFRAVFILGLTEGVLPLHSAVEAEEIEREAALLYVAMTRAKELLYLSTSNADQNGRLLKQSRFLAAIAPDCDWLDFAAASAGAK